MRRCLFSPPPLFDVTAGAATALDSIASVGGKNIISYCQAMFIIDGWLFEYCLSVETRDDTGQAKKKKPKNQLGVQGAL